MVLEAADRDLDDIVAPSHILGMIGWFKGVESIYVNSVGNAEMVTVPPDGSSDDATPGGPLSPYLPG